MGAKADRRWPVAAAVILGGLFVGAGGFGLFRAAHAEPVPAAPPQFRPAIPDPAVTPALGIVPAGPPVAAIPARPGDLLPTPELPAAGPPPAEGKAIPMRASDLPAPPPAPAEVLPLPMIEVKPEPAKPIPVPTIQLPSAKTDGDQKTVPGPPLEVVPLPAPVEIPQPAPAAKSAQPTVVPPAVDPGKALRPSDPGLNVKPVEPAPPVTIEFPATPAVELNQPTTGSAGRQTPAVPTSRVLTFPPTPPGDAPMPLSFRTIARAAVLGTVLLAAPALADDPKPTDTVKYADLEPIKEQLKKVREDLDALKSLDRQLKDLKEALEGRADKGGLSDDGLLKTVRKLQASLDTLNTKLTTLETKLNETTRTVGSSPLGGGPMVVAAKAAVKIVNEYPIEVSMLVNGVPYRVAASTTKEVPVVPGGFTYQLLTSGSSEVSRQIKDGETVTLRVR
jgi:hypothetical protein